MLRARCRTSKTPKGRLHRYLRPNPRHLLLWRQMASSLRRIGSQSSTAYRFVLPQLISRFSTDALSVEYNAGEIGTVSGIPDEHLQRRHHSKEQEKLESGKSILCQHRRDPYANVGDSALTFKTEADAKSFAERHGWNYTIKKHQTPLMKAKAYSDNFKWKGPPKTAEN